MVAVVTFAAGLLFIAAQIAPTYAFESWSGPLVYSSAPGNIDVYVSTPAGRETHLLTRFGPNRRTRIPIKLDVASIRVTSVDQDYFLGQERLDVQSRHIPLINQLWMFDGDSVCILDERQIPAGQQPTKCPQLRSG
jgi:hypothetical protein